MEGADMFNDDENGTSPFIPIDPSINKCNYFINNANQTVVFEFSNPYGGIPQNLAFNAIGWFVLIILFTILRRAAGNYGRLALVRRDEHEANWTELFFGNGEEYNATGIQTLDPADLDDASAQPEEGLDSIDFTSEVHEKNCCAWVASIFTLTDDQFRRKSGEDAVQYLKFQRYLMGLVSVITFICIVIILPINYQGDMQGTGVEFGHTTISNLKGSSDLLWVHVVTAILLFPLGVFFMRRFSVGLKITVEEHGDKNNDNSVESRTLMIINIPKEFCNQRMLQQHFAEAYGADEISEISVSYDVSKLTTLNSDRERARKARLYCENLQTREGSGQQMIPHTCGIMCMMCHSCCAGGCCCSHTVDALTFYRKEEERLADEQFQEKKTITTKPTGIAFVTFKKLEIAQKVFRQHRWQCCGLFKDPPGSSLSSLLEPKIWTVRYAPPPEDIYWENIRDSHKMYLFKAVTINLFVFVLLFFFTSPPLIISQLEIILHIRNVGNALNLPEKINDFFPTLILWSLSALLPIIVAYTDWWLGHWRRSVENLWIMRKVFIFLLFMVLILPSVGLTSLRGFLEAVISSTKLTNGTSNFTFEWNCIFLPDNGAFFVNYVITSALVGTALELMRFSELLVYAIRMCLARSTAETPSVRKATLYEYPYGFNYGWILLVFALTATYSVVCPLIAPFGLFYLVMKHLVDRYNIYYAYKRSKINKNIHAAAVNFVIFSLLLQQIVLLCFNVLRGPSKTNGITFLNARVIVSLSFIVIFGLIIVGCFFWQIFKGISPIQYHTGGSKYKQGENSSSLEDTDDAEGGSEPQPPKDMPRRYVPNVLRKDFQPSLANTVRMDFSEDDELNSPSRRAYGSVLSEERTLTS